MWGMYLSFYVQVSGVVESERCSTSLQGSDSSLQLSEELHMQLGSYIFWIVPEEKLGPMCDKYKK